MKRFLTMMFVVFAVVAFACVSFAAPEGKIKTQTAPVKEDVNAPKAKVDTTKAAEPKKEEKKDAKDATKGKKVEKKEEPKKDK